MRGRTRFSGGPNCKRVGPRPTVRPRRGHEGIRSIGGGAGAGSDRPLGCRLLAGDDRRGRSVARPQCMMEPVHSFAHFLWSLFFSLSKQKLKWFSPLVINFFFGSSNTPPPTIHGRGLQTRERRGQNGPKRLKTAGNGSKQVRTTSVVFLARVFF